MEISENCILWLYSSLDLVISCLGLHWTNDLPGAMIQVCAITFLAFSFQNTRFLVIKVTILLFLDNDRVNWL